MKSKNIIIFEVSNEFGTTQYTRTHIIAIEKLMKKYLDSKSHDFEITVARHFADGSSESSPVWGYERADDNVYKYKQDSKHYDYYVKRLRPIMIGYAVGE